MLGRWIREEKVSILLGISFAAFTAVMLYASCHILEIYAKERNENRYYLSIHIKVLGKQEVTALMRERQETVFAMI